MARCMYPEAHCLSVDSQSASIALITWWPLLSSTSFILSVQQSFDAARGARTSSNGNSSCSKSHRQCPPLQCRDPPLPTSSVSPFRYPLCVYQTHRWGGSLVLLLPLLQLHTLHYTVQRAAELASEEAERKKREAAFLEAGKQSYERGQYENSVAFLEKAVEKSGKASVLGGEAMMWLALAYQVGRFFVCMGRVGGDEERGLPGKGWERGAWVVA